MEHWSLENFIFDNGTFAKASTTGSVSWRYFEKIKNLNIRCIFVHTNSIPNLAFA